jgi:hypothetical protein
VDERRNWRLIGRGQGIHREDLDEDISVEGLLAGRPSGEGQASFKRWLESRSTGGKESYPRLHSDGREAAAAADIWPGLCHQDAKLCIIALGRKGDRRAGHRAAENNATPAP